MKVKILFFSLFLFVSAHAASARPIFDSVGVKNVNGKKVVLFKVKPKDTYFSIGHRYNVKAKTLMQYNKSKKETLSLGAIVKVPTDMPFKKEAKVKKETSKEKKARLAREAKEAKEAKENKDTNVGKDQKIQDIKPDPAAQIVTKPAETPKQQQAELVPNGLDMVKYKVLPGETLYSIAKRYNSSVEEISKINKLTNTNITPGQELLVKPIPYVVNAVSNATQTVTKDTEVAKRDSTKVVNNASQIKDTIAEHNFNVSKYGLYEKDEKGVATWIDDTSLDPNKKLVLHRTAPIGTVIKITNPMTNRTTFAKVVGRFTDNESTKDVIIVMTKNVADSLGALDKRFHVNISYGSPNE